MVQMDHVEVLIDAVKALDALRLGEGPRGRSPTLAATGGALSAPLPATTLSPTAQQASSTPLVACALFAPCAQAASWAQCRLALLSYCGSSCRRDLRAWCLFSAGSVMRCQPFPYLIDISTCADVERLGGGDKCCRRESSSSRGTARQPQLELV